MRLTFDRGFHDALNRTSSFTFHALPTLVPQPQPPKPVELPTGLGLIMQMDEHYPAMFSNITELTAC